MRSWGRRAALVAVLSMAVGEAATAILDCMGDAASRQPGGDRELALGGGQVIAMQFRSTSLKGWRTSGAKLMVHAARGRCTGERPLLAGYAARFGEKERARLRLPKAPAQVACREAGAGWWQIDLPASISQRLVDEPNGAILLRGAAGMKSALVLHSRETLEFTPRLLVEGTAP